MSLSKLMKEEGKRSKSASPKVTPGPGQDGAGKRKPEDEVDDEDLAKRARLAAGNAVQEAAEPSFNTDSASVPPVLPETAATDQADTMNSVELSQDGAAEEAVVKQELGLDEGNVSEEVGLKHATPADEVGQVVKTEPTS
jgi:hypothetical protein